MDLNRKLFLGTLGTFILYFGLSIPALIAYFQGTENFLIIGSKKYTEADLKKSGYGPFKAARKEYVTKLGQVYDSFADEEVVKLEAKKAGITPEEYLNQELGKYNPSEEETLGVYDMFKDRLQGKSYEEVRPDIVNYLKRQKEGKLRETLRKNYNIQVVTEKAERVKVAEKNNPSLGPDNAKVTIIEFSDFECPFCKRSQDVNRALREKYKDKIRWVFRDYPLPFHGNAMFAHVAANCSAKQGKYWDYFNNLFENTGNLPRENVIELAKKSGLDMVEFNKCVEDKDGKIAAEIQEDVKDGQEVGVNGTPAFFINGIMVEGAQPLENFESIIEKELQ